MHANMKNKKFSYTLTTTTNKDHDNTKKSLKYSLWKKKLIIISDRKQTQAILFSCLTVLSILGLIYLVFSRLYLDKSINFPICRSSHESYDFLSNATIGNYKKFSVAVDNAHCSSVGKDILMKNGSVVDAAIAAGLCNGVMNAHSTGIGGGMFMIIYLKDKKAAYSINARETAPLSAHKDMFTNDSPLLGGLSTAIPGEIYGYWEAHKLAGKLPWRTLFEPTIRMCRHGFRVSKILSKVLAKSESQIRDCAVLAEIFIDKRTNKTFQEHDLIKMPSLANTLDLISTHNIKAFYNSKLTKQMVDEINKNGGKVTLEDFKRYRPQVSKAIKVDLDSEYQLFTSSLPSSGILVSFIMKIMSQFDLGPLTDNKFDKTLYYHRLVEAFKHAYAHRSLLGDEPNDKKIQELVENILNENYLESVRAKINDYQTHSTQFYADKAFKEDKGTAHISILGDNDAVALTSSINTYFGAKYAGSRTGIVYNNQMDDFSVPGLANSYGLEPSEANFIKPGKRPMSSMSPVIITDSKANVKLILGASGGSKILSAVSQVAIKVLWQNMNLKDAIDDRRVHHQLHPDAVQFEDGFDLEVHRFLRAMGHNTNCFESGGSVIQGIHRLNDKEINAYSDPRKGGASDGF